MNASDVRGLRGAISVAAAVAVVMAGCWAGAQPVEAHAAAQQLSELTGDITFSVPSGTFRGQLSVRLSTGIAGAQIRYTTNGRQPTATSTVYSGDPLSFTTTTQLRAQAFVAGTIAGAMGSAMYVAREVEGTHDLPLVVMDAYGRGKPPQDEYRDVAFMVMDTHGGAASLAQAPTVATRAGFHLRGQSSAAFEKAPYRLELWDNQGEDAKYPILGMPADSDWALRGPFPDKTLIRDALAYGLGTGIGLRAPRFAFVELYLNLDGKPMAADDYRGVYLLVETIKRSQDRLDIEKLHSTDVTMPAISGGYILQFNTMVAEPPLLECTRNPYRPEDPCWADLEVVEPNDLVPEQQAWLTRYIQAFHDALHGEDPANPKTGYPAYIDVDSFVDRIIHNELFRPGDAYVRSTHFYKDRGGKLFAGPLWDYDLSCGAFTGFGGGSTGIEGWQFQQVEGEVDTTDWFMKLMLDPAFSSRVNARWRQLRQSTLSNQQIEERIAELTEPLAGGAQRNFQRWPILGTPTVGGLQTQVTQTWEQQIQVMRNYLFQRAAWLDGSGWQPR